MLVNPVLIFIVVSACILKISVLDAVVEPIAMTSFTAVMTILGDHVCAIYPVAMTTILSLSVMQCSLKCQRINSCGGFNFRDSDNICEQISANSVVFGVKQGCKYFTVSTLYIILPFVDVIGCSIKPSVDSVTILCLLIHSMLINQKLKTYIPIE
jgi:hypothetical protein